MVAATVLDTPVRRRDGVELADAWEALRQRVETRPAGLRVTARVLRSRLDLFVRIIGTALVAPPEDTGGTWVTVELAFQELRAVRQLLQFSTSLEVLEPPEARAELARAAASVTALYADVRQPDTGRTAAPVPSHPVDPGPDQVP